MLGRAVFQENCLGKHGFIRIRQLKSELCRCIVFVQAFLFKSFHLNFVEAVHVISTFLYLVYFVVVLSSGAQTQGLDSMAVNWTKALHLPCDGLV